MSTYTVTRASTVLSTTNDLLTIISASSRRVRIIEISIGGMGTTSAANSVMVQRSTGGTTGGGAITPEKTIGDAPAASTVVNTTWAAQPSLSGTPLLRLPVNSNGGVYRWVARPGQEIELRNGEQLSIRSETGTGNVVTHVVFEEL